MPPQQNNNDKRVTMILLLSIVIASLFVLTNSAFVPPTALRISGYHRLYSASTGSSDDNGINVGVGVDYDGKIASCKKLLNKAVETKSEDPTLVLNALTELEQLMRQQRNEEPEATSLQILDNLTGDWRLIFTTGTKSTQDRFKTKINYFPFKAIQSFNSTTTPMQIENGIYAGDFALLNLFGDFTFDLRKSKLEFTFDRIAILGFKIDLRKGSDVSSQVESNLESKSNVKNVNNKKDNQGFFSWISADETIATARGKGGGLALWQRVNNNKT